MASFTLIHGSGQNASAWDAVVAILRQAGHAVCAPELPKLQPDWGLRAFGAHIAARMPAGAPRVAVASSFSGVFLPLLAADALVFDAAVVPEPGRSVREQFAADPTMFAPAWIASGARWQDPIAREQLAREFLFHDVPDPTAALRTVETFDTRHLVTAPCPLERLPATRYAVLVATRDRALTPDWQRRTARRLGVAPIEIDAGHCPHTTRPEEFAAILQRIANEAAR